jgi:tRNA (uracil-5-)-methyltransferase
LATLIYQKQLEEEWIKAAKNIQDSLEYISITGRSKKQKIVIGEEDLEMLCKYANSSFKILQNDLVFFQPNFYLYSLMISFITKATKESQGFTRAILWLWWLYSSLGIKI